MYSKVCVHALLLDPITERHILLLKSEVCEKALPIWIGSTEANAIALEIEKIRVPRPMTHDLICGILDRVGVSVREVHICDLKENTYFAELILDSGSAPVPVDARPSDAVAIAVRTGAPILVADCVFARFAESECEGEPCADQVRKWLEGFTPEDLGQYKM